MYNRQKVKGQKMSWLQIDNYSLIVFLFFLKRIVFQFNVERKWNLVRERMINLNVPPFARLCYHFYTFFFTCNNKKGRYKKRKDSTKCGKLDLILHFRKINLRMRMEKVFLRREKLKERKDIQFQMTLVPSFLNLLFLVQK